MPSFKKPSVQNLLDELDIPSYLPVGQDRTDIISTVQEALESMEQKPTDYRLHIEKVHDFMKALWKKYDCEEVFRILQTLTRIEPALLDLERDPEAGKRYRDHYVHVFHVFVFGLRILSGIIRQLGDNSARSILKVEDEQFAGRIRGRDAAGNEVEFHDYSWKERMFYLWTLMSTLHDIAVPMTHLDNIRDALNKFSEKFHLEISGPALVPSFSGDLDAYLQEVSRLFEGKFEPDPVSPWLYKKYDGGAYIKGHLERLVNRNHGVLGSFLTYKMIEEIFLQGKSQKYRLDAQSFQSYRELVLQEDIVRATLAICLHDLEYDDESGSPSFMPLSFDDYPLTFILILADSLQEYLRWEGRTIRGDTKLVGFPALRVRARPDKFLVECSFSVTDEPGEQVYFCNEVVKMIDHRGWHSSGHTVRDAANDFCRILDHVLGKKIQTGPSNRDRFTLRLHFFEGTDLLCTQAFRTPRR